jgi:uracil-DNA glycosylase
MLRLRSLAATSAHFETDPSWRVTARPRRTGSSWERHRAVRKRSRGKPFVGKAGRRLDEGLSAQEVDRSNVYITNAVLCHPRGNVSPPPREAIRACQERLISEIRDVLRREGQRRTRGKVLALGKTAGKALTGNLRPIEQLRLLRPAPNPYLGGHGEV